MTGLSEMHLTSVPSSSAARSASTVPAPLFQACHTATRRSARLPVRRPDRLRFLLVRRGWLACRVDPQNNGPMLSLHCAASKLRNPYEIPFSDNRRAPDSRGLWTRTSRADNIHVAVRFPGATAQLRRRHVRQPGEKPCWGSAPKDCGNLQLYGICRPTERLLP